MDERSAILRARETMYAGRLFTVTRDHVVLPSGRDAAMEVVHHPGSVVLVPMPDPDRVILVRQYRYVIDRWIWELPAGTLHPGERPEEAARRECHEEIGRRPNTLEALGTFYPSPGVLDETMAFFRATDFAETVEPPELDADEDLEPRTFTVQELRALMRSGEIVDMKTMMGLALVTAGA